MTQPDTTPRRPGLWMALAVTAVTGASAVGIALPSPASADPVPAPPTTTAAAPPPAAPAPPPPAPDSTVPAAPPPPADPNAVVDPAAPPPPVDPNAPPPPVDPNAPPPPPADPNAPPPPADPNAAPAPAPAPEPGRINNAAGGFSYLLPAGWTVSDASRLNYGQALLSKLAGPAPAGPGQEGQPAPIANDTSVLIGRLDLKLFAGAEQDNSKAAVRLASDMGEFFMPFPGVRINQQSTTLQAGDLSGSASSYEVKFTDTTKPNGQIWAGVIGSAAPNAPRDQRNQRWFVVWLGTGKDPVDAAAAKALTESIKPYTPPPAPVVDPNAPADPNAPPPVAGGRVPVGVPVPVETPVPEMMPPG